MSDVFDLLAIRSVAVIVDVQPTALASAFAEPMAPAGSAR